MLNARVIVFGASHCPWPPPPSHVSPFDARHVTSPRQPRVAFHDHPLFVNEDRLSASLRTLFGRYRAKVESDVELYLRRRFIASLSALLQLRYERMFYVGWTPFPCQRDETLGQRRCISSSMYCFVNAEFSIAIRAAEAVLVVRPT